MSNAELGLRDALDHEREELPRTHSRRVAAQAQARQRRLAYEQGRRTAARAYAPLTSASRSHASLLDAPRVDDTPRAGHARDAGRTRVGADGVRIVKIRGQATPPRRRPLIDVSRPIGRYDQHPDRAAQWALFLGVFMVVVAIVTGS